jgi:heat shock protein HtpX
MALSRGREFEADRSGARLIGDGEPLARALLKLEAGSKQIPMKIDPAHAQAYIVNPLAAVKNMSFKNLWRTHPPPRTGSSASRRRVAEGLVASPA